jgi:hypothetical protein
MWRKVLLCVTRLDGAALDRPRLPGETKPGADPSQGGAEGAELQGVDLLAQKNLDRHGVEETLTPAKASIMAT